jgi:F-type H+-transporting ATPase subunit b
MDETLRQVGGLLLGSIPTIVLLTLLYATYKTVVHKPLVRVLSERYNRTEGSIEKARADIAAAEARTAEYEQRLREARVAVFKLQEMRRQQALQLRAAAVAEARSKAQERVSQAKVALEQDKVAALASLKSEAEELGAEIIRTVLQPVRAAETPAVGRD